jgi:HEAT repeat protein
MPTLDTLLVAGCAVAALLWLGLSAYVLAVQRRRTDARASLARATALLRRDDVRLLPLADRVVSLRPVIADASRDMVMHGAADGEATPEIAEALIAFLVERWGLDDLERDAASHHGARGKWRRITALRILSQLRHPRHIELLAQAAGQADSDVASIAFSLLGGLEDPRAGEILISALVTQRHPASRVAVHLDRSLLNLAARLRLLLREADPVVRLWAATLLGRYPGVDGLERDLVSLTDDPDRRVW